MTLASRFELPGDPSELTLELARRSHEPSAADRARNLTALRGRLGLPAPVSSPLLSSPVPPLQPLAPAAAARALRLAPWQQLVGVGVLTGAIGFFLGLGVSERASSAPVSAPLAAGTALQHVPAPSPLPASVKARAEPTLTEPVVNQPVAARPLVAAPPAQIAAKAPARAVKVRRAVVPERSDPALLEAVRLLGRARRALDRQEPALALGLLDELDARFARELLDEERAATRVLALCASGEHAGALALARRWFVDRPRSIYTRRLELSCASAALHR